MSNLLNQCVTDRNTDNRMTMITLSPMLARVNELVANTHHKGSQIMLTAYYKKNLSSYK